MSRSTHQTPLRLSWSLLFLGVVSIVCWVQIHLLGDARLHLALFYGWFAVAFAVYLGSLVLISKCENEKRPRWANTPLLVILLGAIAFRLCLLTTTPTLSDDIYRYRWDGKVQQAGIDPYRYPPNDPALAFLHDAQDARINFPHLRTVYPPLTERAFQLGTVLGGTVTTHKAVFVAAEIITMLSLIFILLWRNLSPLWLVAYAWHPLTILEVAGSGHNDALGVAFVWFGIAAWQAQAWGGVAVAWAAAFVSKFGSILMLPWWWFRGQGRRWMLLFLALAALPIACCLTVITALFESLSAMTIRFESNASVYRLLVWLIGSAGIARALSVALGIGFLFWWARRATDPIRYLGGALGMAALISPVLHPWYLLWLIPCFCFWRMPALVALTGTVVLAYTVWPGYLNGGAWRVPLWARLLEYGPVALCGIWSVRRWWLGLSFPLATRLPLSARS